MIETIESDVDSFMESISDFELEINPEVKRRVDMLKSYLGSWNETSECEQDGCCQLELSLEKVI